MQDMFVEILALVLFVLFILILVAMKKLCGQKLKDFAMKKIDSLKEIWMYNGMIKAIAFTFLSQCIAVGAKLKYINAMEE